MSVNPYYLATFVKFSLTLLKKGRNNSSNDILNGPKIRYLSFEPLKITNISPIIMKNVFDVGRGVLWISRVLNFKVRKLVSLVFPLPFSQSHNQECTKKVKSLVSMVRRRQLIFCLG